MVDDWWSSLKRGRAVWLLLRSVALGLFATILTARRRFTNHRHLLSVLRFVAGIGRRDAQGELHPLADGELGP